MSTISGAARLAGVMGWPVAHSLSPRLHGYWLEHYKIDGAYIPMPVAPKDFEAALKALPKLGFAGVNLTVPHKEAALALADTADDLTRRLGAANTLIFKADGHIEAHNTDGYGFIENLRDHEPGLCIDAAPAVVVGAGGSARAVVAALSDAGAPEVRLINRTKARAEALKRDLGGPVTVIDWEARAGALGGAGLLVNTTTQGLRGQPALELSLDALPKQARVADLIYSPLDTPLLVEAKARGHRTIDGLGMLLHQARPGFTAWFGVEPRIDDALRHHVLAGLKT
ncbi:MAG: shikimate dehydrogenase [Alphaproteobacteria bacterium]|nr:shikimate dehydrogenase [Alphaproteobacteria bacterium]